MTAIGSTHGAAMHPYQKNPKTHDAADLKSRWEEGLRPPAKCGVCLRPYMHDMRLADANHAPLVFTPLDAYPVQKHNIPASIDLESTTAEEDIEAGFQKARAQMDMAEEILTRGPHPMEPSPPVQQYHDWMPSRILALDPQPKNIDDMLLAARNMQNERLIRKALDCLRQGDNMLALFLLSVGPELSGE
jgi:hypothetical protein